MSYSATSKAYYLAKHWNYEKIQRVAAAFVTSKAYYLAKHWNKAPLNVPFNLPNFKSILLSEALKHKWQGSIEDGIATSKAYYLAKHWNEVIAHVKTYSLFTSKAYYLAKHWNKTIFLLNESYENFKSILLSEALKQLRA